ncbi:hypothetical protein JB92DRAFT_3102809 [Gautieria morchelliformis]|nr:hypothetical protein JB92DRAFT_3102809 [Gautieria morchelliformis]
MIHPPFPRLSELTYNFLLVPGPPSEIHARISKWQASSRQLSAWIEKAKINSAQTTDCSWESPTSPLFPVPDSPEPSKVFVESAEPSFCTARAFHAEVKRDTLKHTRDFSPEDPSCNGSDSNKKQRILWQPSLARLVELRRSLISGEVDSFAG